MYRIGNNLVLPGDRLVLGFHRDEERKNEILATHGFGEADVVARFGDAIVVRLQEQDDAFRRSRILTKVEGVRFAEPDFITIFEEFPLPTIPADPIIAAEPTIAADSAQPPSDDEDARILDQLPSLNPIRLLDTHKKLATGKREILVAILDVGVEETHVDLNGVFEAGYNAVDDGSHQTPADHEYHGTACAGLAVAPADRTGIRGVGAGCGLLAVKIAQGLLDSTKWKICEHIAKRGIDWAVDHKADVLSISWYAIPESTLITDAIARARTEGRDGKGCVVVAAAGNRSESSLRDKVDFPACVTGVLAVAATAPGDQPKRLNNGGGGWESASGPEIGIAAPGVAVFTTDLTGTRGCHQAPVPGGNYCHFHGTSAATPMVAGAAALVLSVKPELREDAVRAVLCENADKVPDKNEYSPPGNTGRNKRMGHGRLNVFAAVGAVKPKP